MVIIQETKGYMALERAKTTRVAQYFHKCEEILLLCLSTGGLCKVFLREPLRLATNLRSADPTAQFLPMCGP
jgi:hypothetical protein